MQSANESKKGRIANMVLIFISVLIVLYFALLFISLFTVQITSISINDNTNEQYVGDVIITPDDMREEQVTHLNDSMPHYQYKHLEDSINAVHTRQTMPHSPVGSSWISGFLGFGRSKTDSTYFDEQTGQFKEKKIAPKYYMCLTQYRLKEFASTHQVGQQTYIKYPVWDSVRQKSKARVGHYVMKPIPFYISELTESDKHNADALRTLYVPISKRAYTITQIGWGITSGIMTIASLLLCIILPLWILKDIATGQAFHKKTFFRIYRIAYFILFSSLLQFTGAVVMYLVYKDSLYTYATLHWNELLSNLVKGLLTCAAILILGMAFKRGYRLQHEQDLTI